MTIRPFGVEEARDFWLSLSKDRPPHNLRCSCDICLYFSQPKKPRFSRRTFAVAWFIHKIKLDHLIENKKARRVRFQNEWAWEIDGLAYDKAPFRKRLKEILADVYDCTGDDGLLDPAKGDSVSNYIKRSGANKFVDFKESIIFAREREWLKSRPDLEKGWKENRENMHLCQRIADFVRSRPDHRATQRELERHFSNKRKADLERAIKWLSFYPNLRRRKEGKSVIFCWRTPTLAEVKAYNQKVAEQILAEGPEIW